MQLLALDRNARPQSAAEVMQRLSAIAELPLRGAARGLACVPVDADAGRSRSALLVVVRKRLLSLARGDGGTLLIEGVAGAGRSRLLDACVLEAKLLGARGAARRRGRRRAPATSA